VDQSFTSPQKTKKKKYKNCKGGKKILLHDLYEQHILSVLIKIFGHIKTLWDSCAPTCLANVREAILRSNIRLCASKPRVTGTNHYIIMRLVCQAINLCHIKTFRSERKG
jgi:hypothetical protein